MGLGGWTNTNYRRGLAALIDAEPERYAVIDVGTNSVKFHIAQRVREGTWRSVVDRAEVTRLGEGLEERRRDLTRRPVPHHRCLRAMVDEAKKNGVRAIAAVGTAGLRIAGNREAVLAAMREATGISVEVISGEEEARLAYLAVVTWLGLGPTPWWCSTRAAEVLSSRSVAAPRSMSVSASTWVRFATRSASALRKP